jgi:ribokinase
VQLARLAGEALFLTAVGDDALGRRAVSELEAHGVRVAAAFRAEPQRRVFVHVDGAGERTITVLGRRIAPQRSDALSWNELAHCDAIYFTAGDADALRAARAARVLVATPRARATLAEAPIRLDVLVGSAGDAGERVAARDLDPPPDLLVQTEGASGGRYVRPSGETGRFAAAPLTGPIADTYGAGDSFAAGLTYALGAGLALPEALECAAQCGAAALARRGPL